MGVLTRHCWTVVFAKRLEMLVKDDCRICLVSMDKETVVHLIYHCPASTHSWEKCLENYLFRDLEEIYLPFSKSVWGTPTVISNV